MKPHIAKRYLEEIIMQADMAVGVVHNINAACNGGHVVEVFRQLHYLLLHTSNVSKILWPGAPGESRAAQRGAELRKLMALPDEHPLAQRTLRNHLEHYDERLDAW